MGREMGSLHIRLETVQQSLSQFESRIDQSGLGHVYVAFGFTASARSIRSIFIDLLMSERARLGVYVFRPHDVVRLTRSQARSEMKRMNSFDLFRHIPHCLSWLGGMVTQASEPRKEECEVRATEHRRMIANVKCQ